MNLDDLRKITRIELPETYKPYQRLTVCSNELIGGRHLVVLGEVLPLLVGSGERPMIWLQAPSDKSGKSFVSLVASSVASHPAVSVVSNKDGLIISAEGVVVVHVAQIDSESAVIDLLDLRPIGLDIHGGSTSLSAGDATFSKNTLRGGGTLLAFGDVRGFTTEGSAMKCEACEKREFLARLKESPLGKKLFKKQPPRKRYLRHIQEAQRKYETV